MKGTIEAIGLGLLFVLGIGACVLLNYAWFTLLARAICESCGG